MIRLPNKKDAQLQLLKQFVADSPELFPDLRIESLFDGTLSTKAIKRIHLGAQLQFTNGELQESTLADLYIDELLLHGHLCMFGKTRRGKSKLFELLGRFFIDCNRGFCLCDPHSDTADDLPPRPILETG